MVQLLLCSHTLLLTVGPSKCGKTHTCVQKILPHCAPEDVLYVSSDEYRFRLLGTREASEARMKAVSKNAFDLLRMEVKTAMQWPVAKRLILVDSTGLSAQFRQDMQNLADEHHYLFETLVFDYRKYADYMCLPGGNHTLIAKQVSRLRTDTLPNIHATMHRVPSAHADIQVSFTDEEEYRAMFLEKDDYIVVGDVHDCYDELMALLRRFDALDDGGCLRRDVILAGSWSGDKLGAFFANNASHMHASRTCYIRPGAFVVTHAPCESKYLGKITPEAQAAQTSSSTLPDPERSFPLHCFGHVTYADLLRHANFVGLGTGCSQGGKLSGVRLKGKHCESQSVPALRPLSADARWTEPPSLVLPKLRELTDQEEQRIRTLLRDKVQFISGTMAPAAASAEEMEPLETAMEYFREKFARVQAADWRLSIERKFMGSRSNIYLTRGGAVYAVSRNGFRIRHTGLDEAFRAVRERMEPWMAEHNVASMIIDAELMPWSVLGKGLIEDSFVTVGVGMQTEMKTLEALGETTAPEEAKELDVFRNQVQLYSRTDVAPHFKPFSILKVVYEDGRTELPESQIENYRTVSSVENLVVDLRNFHEALATATAFFTRVTAEGEEGVVLKPNRVPGNRCVPFLKVRNAEYLSLVYGPKYRRSEVHKRLLREKCVKRKMQISLQEWELGRRMLLAENDEERRKLFVQFLYAEDAEKTVDARL